MSYTKKPYAILYFVPALVLSLLIISVSSFAQETTMQIVFHIEDATTSDPLFHATVSWFNHSATLTDQAGNCIFNVEPSDWPITVQASCPGYDNSPDRQYLAGTIYGNDPTNTYHIISLFPSFGAGEEVNRSANKCCGAATIVSSVLLSFFMVIHIRRKEGE